MTIHEIYIDDQECWGCKTCEVACKQEHNLPVGVRWIMVSADGPREIAGSLRLNYVVTHCLHCSHPPCRDDCPASAITKRDDGIVLIDETLCISCQNCLVACPLRVVQFEADSGVAQKCNLCVERIDQGLMPACVNVCPSQCIYFGDIQEIAERIGHERLPVWK